MQLLDFCVVSDNYKFFHNCNSNKMDYRQKQSTKNEDEDDEDLEALRLAALQSLRAKDTVHYKKHTLSQLQKVVPEVTQTSRPPYKGQRPPRRGYFPNQLQQRRNGNLYYQSPRNPNLIAIVPVDEHSLLQQTDPVCPVEETAPSIESHSLEVSKFHRFKDSGSGSDDEENKDQTNTNTSTTKETGGATDMQTETSSVAIESSVETLESSKKTEEDQDDTNDDDDDILLMADLEEEDSLERLMDEMEREMNVDKPSERKEKKGNKKGNKESEKKDEAGRNASLKNRTGDNSSRKECCSPSVPVSSVINERRSMSPHISRILQKRRSLSPRSRSRKKSPRRSPRRSPIRQTKKSQREITRYRSPRKSPVRYSPRSRSPKLLSRSRSPRLSPRRSPNRSPIRRSPIKKSSSRGRSPRQSKSPRPIRSPKASLTKSPRSARLRSPKYSPLKLSPQSKSPLRSRSPKLSPRRISPPSHRTPPKSKSPGLSPRRGFSRLLSPKYLQSPRRMSPRSRSPRLSPHTSPWSSPRNSPRASPRRRRSPRWSPKELSRKHRPRSVSLDDTRSPLYIKESSPTVKSRVSPEISRIKIKQKEENLEKTTVTEEETTDLISDPVLEARRRKFECARPIDPVNANKKIKLNKQENVSKKTESLEGETQSGNLRKVNKTTNDYEIQETDLCLDAHYEDFEDFEESMENTSPIAITSSVNSCIDVEPQKIEKEKSSKKKKKRDKELYQVGKLKSELPLSERIGKDKKCKKRKDVVSDGPSEEMDAIFEDITVDEESDLRTELSRRRAERLNRTIPIQSARLVQSAFKGVVNEVVKSNAKTNQRHLIKADDKSNQKEVRRVTVLHRSIPEIHDSEDESTLDAKVPVRFRLGLGKQVQDTRESKISRKASKRQGRKVKHKVNLTLTNVEHAL